MNKEQFLAKIRSKGFLPEKQPGDNLYVLVFKTGFCCEGDYKKQLISGLEDLRVLVEERIEVANSLKG